MTTQDVSGLLELAERFELRAMKRLEPDKMLVGPNGELWLHESAVAHAADCFTVAAALRSRAHLKEG